jgi:hypothetical protein
MALFQNCGLFWHADDVFFGRPGNQGAYKGELLGNRDHAPLPRPIDFGDQIGVYALYADFDLVYVGQVGGGNNRLLNRLRHHKSKGFSGRWNRFSWFGLRRVLANGQLSNENEQFHPTRQEVLGHVEGIILQFSEPPLNGQEGSFGADLERYVQLRHPKLGPTTDEIVRGVYDATPAVKTATDAIVARR